MTVPPPLPPETILSLVADAFAVTKADIIGRGKETHICAARAAAAMMLRASPVPGSGIARTYAGIGKLLGGKNHGAIMSNVAAGERAVRDNPIFAASITHMVDRALRETAG